MANVTKHEKTRVIQGVILKCIDGRWTDGDSLTPPTEMLVIGITRALQCWGRDRDLLDVILEQPGKTLPDADELNEQIPASEWPPGLDGKPRRPWSLNWIAYLLDPATASTYTFINSTTGARVAVERLEDRIKWMRTLRGANVAPIVKLDSRPMKTKMGVKQRPEFTVLEWRDLSGDGPNTLQLRSDSPSAPQLEYRPESAPAQNPEIGPDVIKRVEPAAPPAAKSKKKAAVGKPVNPTTISEEIDDALPDDLAAPPINIRKAG